MIDEAIRKMVLSLSGKTKNVLFAKQETFCDSTVTDKVFHFHEIKGWDGQSDAIVQLEHTLLYLAPLQSPSLTLFKELNFARFYINQIYINWKSAR